MTTVLVLVACLVPPQALAASFSEIYQTYKGALEAKNWPLALSSSKQTLEEGVRSFDIQGENVANLRLNYARELLRDSQYALAKDQLELCLAAKTANHGRQSPELIDVLFELAKSTVRTDGKKALKHYQRVLKLVAREGNEPLEATIKLNAGLSLMKAGESKAASGYLRDAREFYTRRYGSGDIRAGLAGLNLGQIEFNNKDNKKARQTLTSALEAFQSPEPASRQLNAATRKVLVNVLETMKMPDEATQHVVAFALNNAVDGYAEPTMLYRSGGATLAAQIRNSGGTESSGSRGRAVVHFDVDENGFVVNPRIGESSSEAVSSNAIRSVTSRRYSPRIEDGKPVFSRDLQYRYRIY